MLQHFIMQDLFFYRGAQGPLKTANMLPINPRVQSTFGAISWTCISRDCDMTPRYLYRSVVDKGAHVHVDILCRDQQIVL